MNPLYLGDGVYAHVDELQQVVLTTGTHVLAEAENVVYLDPRVMAALVDYARAQGVYPG